MDILCFKYSAKIMTNEHVCIQGPVLDYTLMYYTID